MRKLLVLGAAAAVALSGFAASFALADSSADTADVYTYRATMTRRAEVPPPKAPLGARGVFTATVTERGSGATITWKLTYRGLSGMATGAHIHKGKPGIAGAVLVPLCGPCVSGKKGKATITKAVAALLERGRTYVNVHTKRNPAGEIRGQVKLTGQTTTDDTTGTSTTTTTTTTTTTQTTTGY